MITAIQVYRSTGSSVESVCAMRADGQWFARSRVRGPYGWRWTAWREVSAPDLSPPSYDQDFGEVGAGWVPASNAGAVRLPKV